MARIYDNLETKFTDGLQGIISNVGVKRVDFCVGYFNLRGWNLIVNEVDQLSGDFVYEQNNRIFCISAHTRHRAVVSCRNRDFERGLRLVPTR